MDKIKSITNAWMSVRDGLIHDFGSMKSLDPASFPNHEVISLGGSIVLPTWVDSHTHLVFAGWREKEFEDRLKGLSYEEIANRGGGILNSAKRMQDASEDDLYSQAMSRLHTLIRMGTGAIEIKSGYGLSLESELKMLRVIQKIKRESPIPVKATFLGAHAVPKAFNGDTDKYVQHIIHEMLPAVSSEHLADYIDVFCEKGYFSVEQTTKIMEAGAKCDLKAKIHVNQFNIIGGIKACVQQNAVSVDHLEVLDNDDIGALKNSSTIPVALPSCSFFLGIPYTPAQKLMKAGLPVALATDFNPGSTPSGNMNFVVSLACIKMGMTPTEAVNAATINGAYAMEVANEVGSITKGKRANFIVSEAIDSIAQIPYQFGRPIIKDVYINGDLV